MDEIDGAILDCCIVCDELIGRYDIEWHHGLCSKHYDAWVANGFTLPDELVDEAITNSIVDGFIDEMAGE